MTPSPSQCSQYDHLTLSQSQLLSQFAPPGPEVLWVTPGLGPAEAARDYEEQLRRTGPYWSIVISIDPNWSELVHSDQYQSILVYTGPNWSIMITMDPNRSELVQTGPNWSKRVRTGPNWSVLVGQAFPGEATPRFDLLLLGEQNSLISFLEDSPKPPPRRVTMTLPLLNAARSLLVVATGASKAPVLKRILEAPQEPQPLPAGRLRPRSGRLRWLLDQEAAKELRIPLEKCP
ncbi:hypothetical protein DV515_00018242 [Chloebia gouldiae]|uniref:Glucosamine/galactosamine-6-phosphate isomerase domain-containing protein n=1 Tax=Chloebia gouldiae TaxID=44316 RepID=A0A3L8Q832_CHLGU|nr:hypothetical protein DV515_00018242 [Chloebia gouldiae]